MCAYAVPVCNWPPPCESQQDFEHTLRRSSSCDCTAAGPIILAARATASALAASRAALAVALSTFACTGRGWHHSRTACTDANAAPCTGRGWQRSSCCHLCDCSSPHRHPRLLLLCCSRLLKALVLVAVPLLSSCIKVDPGSQSDKCCPFLHRNSRQRTA